MKTVLSLLCAAFVALLCPGCQGIRTQASRPPAATVKAGGSSVAQDGAAASPGSASTTTTTTAATIPPGVTVTAHPDGSLTWTTAAPLSVVTTHTAETATGPAAFPLPAPPTPTEEAAGRASLWMRLGLVAGIAAAAFGLIRGWDLVAYGGGAIAAGCVAGMALASIPPWLWAVFGIGAAACVIGPVIWHTRLKAKPAPPSSSSPTSVGSAA